MFYLGSNINSRSSQEAHRFKHLVVVCLTNKNLVS
jgi:hypothetical protein